ncbi:MAG: hypothetical protein IPF94_05180 [Betaproteobacteria bacterium]|nr:hypothetical protein [Betaproteobacteria bacterium]
MRKTTLILTTALTLTGPALAGAPLVTETADSLAPGDCELEAAEARERASSLPTLRSTTAILGCGVGAESQAALIHTQTRFDGSREQALRLSGKTTFVAPEPGRAGWGLAYAVETVKAPGSGWRSEALDLVGLYTRELAPDLLVHANLGHSYSRSARQGSTLWSLGIEHIDTVTLAADVFGDDRNRPGVSAGVGFGLGRRFSINATLAWQFDEPRVRVVTLGAKLEF